MKVTLHGHYGGAKAIEVDAEIPDDFIATHGDVLKAARMFARQHRLDPRFAQCSGIDVRDRTGLCLATVKGPRS